MQPRSITVVPKISSRFEIIFEVRRFLANLLHFLCTPQLLKSAEKLRAVPLKKPSKGNPNACMLSLGKDAAELVAPLWDVRMFYLRPLLKLNRVQVLLSSAAASSLPNVCFAILESMCSTVRSLHFNHNRQSKLLLHSTFLPFLKV
jgi:hypothetical protein